MNLIKNRWCISVLKESLIRHCLTALLLFTVFPLSSSAQNSTSADSDNSLFYDSHFHLTNYIQEGIDIHKFLQVMGTKVSPSTLFGIPLQQEWAYENSG